jgi:hypothetical protein
MFVFLGYHVIHPPVNFLSGYPVQPHFLKVGQKNTFHNPLALIGVPDRQFPMLYPVPQVFAFSSIPKVSKIHLKSSHSLYATATTI